MSHPTFSNFLLVGGTALALQEGHRNSVDIDLFGNEELEELEISDTLKTIGTSQILSKSKRILTYSVDGIKVDIVNYPYSWIRKPVVTENIRMASFEDIGAMKLNAISGRGSKKDFLDLYLLLKTFSLKELLEFYGEKYPDGSEFLVVKSLNYFADADKQETPQLYQPFDWEQVKSTIKQETDKYIKR